MTRRRQWNAGVWCCITIRMCSLRSFAPLVNWWKAQETYLAVLLALEKPTRGPLCNQRVQIPSCSNSTCVSIIHLNPSQDFKCAWMRAGGLHELSEPMNWIERSRECTMGGACLRLIFKNQAQLTNAQLFVKPNYLNYMKLCFSFPFFLSQAFSMYRKTAMMQISC